MAEGNIGMEAVYTCSECGEPVYDDGSYVPDYRILNDETPSRRIVCENCFDALWEAGKISQCEACGEWFDYSLFHDELIGDDMFTACPACGRDVIEGDTREHRISEAFSCKVKATSYAVTIAYQDGDNATYLFTTDRAARDFVCDQVAGFKAHGATSLVVSGSGNEITIYIQEPDGEEQTVRILSSRVYE